MRVYARYFSEDNLNFRRTTLIQFGDSWELIGSAVLINPGSAHPISNTPIDGSKIHEISAFLGTECKDDWYEFRSDPTMGWLRKIFEGDYVSADKKRNLKGVIQLFNLFNLRNQNLTEALSCSQETRSSHLFSVEEDKQLFREKPVYLGWGNTGKYDSRLKIIAENIFEYARSNNHYLQPNFEDNSFYHPRYLNMQYKKPRARALLNNFFENDITYQPADFFDKSFPHKVRISRGQIAEVIKEIRKDESIFKKCTDIELLEEGEKTIRFEFAGYENDKLEFTVTMNENGYIGIRGSKPSNGNDRNENLSYKEKYEGVLSELDFLTPRKTWLGTKNISDIDFENRDLESIVTSIFKELENFISSMQSN
ncbi:hypothetical protein [uncultured Sunxiuqinia sp.]|uniref:hypothetical protein n=1 Tax=uncultured Sunxiuqinia sp. TaxID=1573825 RepID=UPI00262FC942|nr:hypothetical protein [uncultured Sunxiuqinia sp.]